MQRALTLQLKRLNFVLSNLKVAQRDVVKLEDAFPHSGEEPHEPDTTLRLTVIERELRLMLRDINAIRRRLII